MDVSSKPAPDALAASPPAAKPKQKRRRCRNCDALFPLTKPNRQFCKIECKNEYNRYGAAFGPLKAKLEKLVRKLVDAETARGWTSQVATLKAAGFVTREQLPAGNVATELAQIRRLLKSFYARVHVLEQAIANTSAAIT